MPVINLDDGQAESLRGILAEVLDMDETYAELQPVYEALVDWEYATPSQAPTQTKESH
jgi:hypothetical protein